MDRVTSQAIWPSGSKAKAWSTCAGLRIIPRPRERSKRWHQTLKNRILLDNYYLPGDLERQVRAFVDHYNHVRYHESIDNLTPADVYFARGKAILEHSFQARM